MYLLQFEVVSTGYSYTLSCSDSRLRLQGVGSVWESCDNIGMLSKDNKSAVLKVCFSQLQLLGDACDEVDEVSIDDSLIQFVSTFTGFDF